MSLLANVFKGKTTRFRQIIGYACRRIHEDVIKTVDNPFDLIKWQHVTPVYEENILTLCRLKEADFGDSGTSIRTQRYYHDRYDRVVDIKGYSALDRQFLTCVNFELMSLYDSGFGDIIDTGVFQLVGDSLPIPPEINKDLVSAVKTLYTFLHNIEYHENCLYELTLYQDKDRIYSDAEITALLTNHLFSPLTSNDPRYLSSISDRTETELSSCPCTDECATQMHYYDYEIGNEGMGFKKPSILLYPLGGSVMAIDKAEELPKNIYGEGMPHSEQLRTAENKQKMASQAVIMSYYSNQLQLQEKGEVVSTLIPTVFTTWQCFDIYFYDSEKDIFIKTFHEPTQIFEFQSDGVGFKNKFNISAIFQLWMLINHLILKPNLEHVLSWKFENTFGFKEELEYKRLPEFSTVKLPSSKQSEIKK